MRGPKGDVSALERLAPIVHDELRRLARRQMAAESPGHMLQPSALVNEAYLKLMGDTAIEWNDRNHFYAVLARMMRQILTDFARARGSQKRGEHARHVAVEDVRGLAKRGARVATEDLVAVDMALDELAALDARQAKVVELRFFGGLENAEIACVIGVSEPTVIRDWRVARAWLFDRLGGDA
jgi:RNA polymerase sigma factor (TIGR02999 family)